MISYEKLLQISSQYQEELTNFRLTGDVVYLMNFIEAVMCADRLVLTEEFFNALTINETTAFEAVREEIGLSGNISVVKMIQKTNLSRPVWTSLLQKMEKYGIAIVKNQGVKGTYIEFIEEAPIND